MKPPRYTIPFNEPTLVGRELEYIEDAVRSGQLDGNAKQTWMPLGGSHLPSEVVSAFPCAQLENLELTQERRLSHHRQYRIFDFHRFRV